MSKKLNFKSRWGDIEVELVIGRYETNNVLALALISYDEDGCPEPYGSVTVNLKGTLPDEQSYVDTNDMPEIIEFIEEYGLGKAVGISRRSGYCDFPLYEFDMDRINELVYDYDDEDRQEIGDWR